MEQTMLADLNTDMSNVMDMLLDENRKEQG